jgi:hypothetical protein
VGRLQQQGITVDRNPEGLTIADFNVAGAIECRRLSVYEKRGQGAPTRRRAPYAGTAGTHPG